MIARTVLHVTHAPDAGVPRVIAQLAEHQLAQGWRVVVACPRGEEADDLARAAGASSRDWTAGRAPDARLPAEVRALAGIVADTAPDVVHLHSSKAGLAGRLLLRGRRRTVFQPHAWSFEAAGGPVGRATRAWERAGARWCHAIVCVSEGERDAGEAAGVAGRFVVVPNGVDVGRFAPGDRAAARAALGLGDAPLAVLVGRLSHQKGQDVLLRTWPAVRRAVPGAEVVLVGDGPDRAALEASAPEGVRLAGKQADVRPWFLAADVVVQPSRWEGMSLAVLEALACGRPVVASAVDGMDAVAAARAGALVAPEDEAALAEAVARRLADPELAAAEGARAREQVERHHDAASAAARVTAVYADAAPGSRGRDL